MTRVPLEVWDPEGRRRLHSRRGSLAVDVLGGPDAQPAALVDAAGRLLGAEVALLRLTEERAVEVACLDPGTTLPRGLDWHPAHLAPRPQDRAPWERPGWYADTVATIDRELAHRGITRTGPPAPQRHTPLVAILRLPTTRGPVWFKAVPPVFACEGPVLAWLADVAPAPAMVPTVVAHGPTWLMTAELPPKADGPEEHAFAALARLQRATSSRIDELLRAGCPYRGLDRLVDDLRSLSERADLLSPGERSALASSRPGVEAACADLEALSLSPTLVHGDFNEQNVRWTSDGWCLYDWGDACVAHPLLDIDRWHSDGDHLIAAWSSLAGWDDTSPPVDPVRQSVTAAGAAHRAVTYQRVIDGVTGPAARAMTQNLRRSVGRLVAALGTGTG